MRRRYRGHHSLVVDHVADLSIQLKEALKEAIKQHKRADASEENLDQAYIAGLEKALELWSGEYDVFRAEIKRVKEGGK